ncbi:MAG: aminoacyl-tRNA hydrolase [Deltaproteobacteria bacterium]|nr:aminoacyl-tRNA hydrolase [Deltaproteobacteria bacterium]
MKVLYGLGNPGKRYILTRHNIGFMVVDRLCLKWGISLSSESSDVVYGKGQIDGIAVMAAKPYTYMNLCGIPLQSLHVRPEDLIVIHDDIDIAFGKIRVRQRGSAGGHRGVDSIINSLGSEDFIRIRCGIGRPPQGCETSDYVLEQFSKTDYEILVEEIDSAVEALDICLEFGVERAMNVFNRRQSNNNST